MKEVWISLITVLGGVSSTFVGLFAWKVKQNKIDKQKRLDEVRKKEEAKRKEEEENKTLKELCNYAFGTIDMIIQDEIKVTPEIRGAMRKASARYHRLDRAK